MKQQIYKNIASIFHHSNKVGVNSIYIYFDSGESPPLLEQLQSIRKEICPNIKKMRLLEPLCSADGSFISNDFIWIEDKSISEIRNNAKSLARIDDMIMINNQTKANLNNYGLVYVNNEIVLKMQNKNK